MSLKSYSSTCLFSPIFITNFTPLLLLSPPRCRVRDEKIVEKSPYSWKDVSATEIFHAKRVVIFAVTGAFTPTCSAAHLPGYQQHYDTIRDLGIDEVYCISVNDAFVMRQWGLHQGLIEEKLTESGPLNPGNFTKVKLLPDGACQFTRGKIIIITHLFN